MRALVLALVPCAAWAEFDELSLAQCEDLVGFVGMVAGGQMAASVTVEGGACVFTDVEMVMADAARLSLRIDRVALEARGVEALIAMEAPLQAVALDVDGLRLRPTVADFPEIDYLMQVQNARNVIDADVSVSWDADSRVLAMDRFEMRFPYEQRVFASFVAENADLSSFAALEASAMQLEVTELRLEATTFGLFEAYVAPVLINGLLGYAEDPEASVRELQAQGVGALRALPPQMWTEGSREALEVLVQDMPLPNGSVAVHVTAEPGLGMLRAGPFLLLGEPESIEDLRPALGGIVVDATYDRVPLE